MEDRAGLDRLPRRGRASLLLDYSVPHALVGEKLDVRLSPTTVEVFHRGMRVASHARSYRRGHHTTVAEHMPAAHRAHSEWSPSRLIRWGQTVGPKTAALVETILSDRPHPEQGYVGHLEAQKEADSFQSPARHSAEDPGAGACGADG